ncbi:hypothetical protein JCGZ_23236 [Jatropha curcas]|uniref:Uncharacterized protein n=1 Tax=Jatropha curcas TaxID=180498 RepID=A0A067JKR0_JATCU|nr:hypothetical protein JCGZ_23236 [Jatropha curcas]
MEHQVNEGAANEWNDGAANEWNDGAANEENEAAANPWNGGSSSQGSGGAPPNRHIPVYYTLPEGKFSVGQVDRSEMGNLSKLEDELIGIVINDVPLLIPTKYIGVRETRYIGAKEEQLSTEDMEWADFINQLNYVNFVGA